MNRGKEKCDFLKSIRKEIADRYGIFYQINECSFQGECKGTCPMCEQETKYLERELKKKGVLKKSLMMAFALPMTLAAQEPTLQPKSDSTKTDCVNELPEVEIVVEVERKPILCGTAPVRIEWEKEETRKIKKEKRKARKEKSKVSKQCDTNKTKGESQ